MCVIAEKRKLRLLPTGPGTVAGGDGQGLNGNQAGRPFESGHVHRGEAADGGIVLVPSSLFSYP